MLMIAILTLTACRIVALPTADQAILSCGSAATTVAIDGVMRPTGSAARRDRDSPEFSEFARHWSGRMAAVEARGGRRRILVDGTDDLAVAIIAAGHGLAAGDDPTLAEAERHARIDRLGIWNLGTWRRRQAQRTAPIEVSPPAPPAAPAAHGLASRIPAVDAPTWDQRKTAFEREIDALEANSGPGADPEF